MIFKNVLPLTIVSFISLFLIYYYWIVIEGKEFKVYRIWAICKGLYESSLIVILLILGKKYFNVNNRIIYYFKKSSFFFYLVHMLVVTYFTFILINIEMNIFVRYLITVIGSNILLFAAYQGISLKRSLLQGITLGLLKG